MTQNQNVTFERIRVSGLLDSLERMGGGDISYRIPISEQRDELDAIAHAVNVMATELVFRLKQLQETQTGLIQAEKLSTLGQVCAGLAHEMNNPLAIVRGYVEHALAYLDAHCSKEESPFQGLTDYLKKIDRAADRMCVVTSHVRDFSRTTQTLHEKVQVESLVMNSFILMNEQLKTRGIEVQVDVGDPDLSTKGCRVRLEQALINFITNARDAIQESRGNEPGGWIRITAKATAENSLEVLISDNGAGVGDSIRDKIFEPFFTTKPPGKGTGLGLSISRSIIREHGGEITCRPHEQGGTTIALSLPRI